LASKSPKTFYAVIMALILIIAVGGAWVNNKIPGYPYTTPTIDPGYTGDIAPDAVAATITLKVVCKNATTA